MLSERFGEVVIIQRDDYPVGIVIRERNNGIILEQHFDSTGNNEDILHLFDNSTIWNKEDFLNSLTVARKYEPDLSIPIYVQR